MGGGRSRILLIPILYFSAHDEYHYNYQSEREQLILGSSNSCTPVLIAVAKLGIVEVQAHLQCNVDTAIAKAASALGFTLKP